MLGEGPYTRFGTLANGYAEAKVPGVRRLLFLGDSVTHRGHLIDALRYWFINRPGQHVVHSRSY